MVSERSIGSDATCFPTRVIISLMIPSIGSFNNLNLGTGIGTGIGSVLAQPIIVGTGIGVVSASRHHPIPRLIQGRYR